MARVTAAEVIQLTSTPLSSVIVDVWINTASTIVDDNEDCIDSDDDTLTQIELMLASHFVTLNGPGATNSNVTSEQTKNLKTEYNRATVTESINETECGKAANALSGGCLAYYDKPKAGFFAIGGDNDSC